MFVSSTRGFRRSFAGVVTLALGVVASLTFATPAFAAYALNWSGAETLDSSTYVMNPLSCVPGTTFCVALDQTLSAGSSRIMTSSNPVGGASTWSAAADLDGTAGVPAVSCPSTSLCVAVSAVGGILYSLNPAGGVSTWINEGLVDADNGPGTISCPTTTFCAVGDANGNVLTSITPTVASSWHLTNVDPSNQDQTNGIVALSCASASAASLCVVFDGGGDIVTSTNPTVGSSWVGPTEVDVTSSITGVSCPSTTLCVAVDAANVFTSTTPAVASSWKSAPVNPGSGAAISCPTVSFCATAGADAATSTNPSGGSGAWSATTPFPSDAAYISCPETTLCVATDSGGPDVWVGTPTVATPQSYTLTVSESGSGHGTVTGSSINCPGACSKAFTAGTSVVLTATPANGSTFSGWSGACSATSATCTVAMSSAEDVTASFALGHGTSSPPTGTTITHPKVNAKKHTASFSFTATGATSYVCELVPPAKKHHKQSKLSFGPCKSPKSYSNLPAGKYTFMVKGVNSAGAAARAAAKRFTIA